MMMMDGVQGHVNCYQIHFDIILGLNQDQCKLKDAYSGKGFIWEVGNAPIFLLLIQNQAQSLGHLLVI